MLPCFRLNMLFSFLVIVLDILYLSQETTVLPGSHSIERFIIDEQLHLTILLNQYERKDW